MMFDEKLVEKAEELVRQRAARHAYLETEKIIQKSDAQKLAYGLIRESIMLGARMMEEAMIELLKKK